MISCMNVISPASRIFRCAGVKRRCAGARMSTSAGSLVLANSDERGRTNSGGALLCIFIYQRREWWCTQRYCATLFIINFPLALPTTVQQKEQRRKSKLSHKLLPAPSRCRNGTSRLDVPTKAAEAKVFVPGFVCLDAVLADRNKQTVLVQSSRHKGRHTRCTKMQGQAKVPLPGSYESCIHREPAYESRSMQSCLTPKMSIP